MEEITHNNHYVPIWYQERFLRSGQTSYHRLDKASGFLSIPEYGVKLNKKIHNYGPKKFFFEEDLYTTRSIFSGVQNDEIERYLFGKIDEMGRAAIEALMSEDWMSEIYGKYGDIFEYMDAQILRTPRGIEWIKKFSGVDTQMELMLYLQAVRKAHCTTWIETAKEIVSAEKSQVKFIVSDNPITLYNPKYHPNKGWHQYEYSDSIPIFHKGTRTLFPIDMNHCLILYNPEYTQNPSVIVSTENRTNARLFDSVIGKIDDIERRRFLTDEEVLRINYLLKNNAEKYIAAAEEEWLFPERYINPSWLSYNKFLLPKYPKYPGEIFMFDKDGKLSYTQDGFGRKPGNMAEWAEKAREAQRIHENINKALENERKKKGL